MGAKETGIRYWHAVQGAILWSVWYSGELFIKLCQIDFAWFSDIANADAFQSASPAACHRVPLPSVCVYPSAP